MLENVTSKLVDISNNLESVAEKYKAFTDPVVMPVAYSDNVPFHFRRLEPDTTNFTYKQNDRINFSFPRIDYLDVSTIRMSFIIRINFTISATTSYFPWDISTVFSRVRLLYNEHEICNISNYGSLNRVLSTLLDESYLPTTSRSQLNGKFNAITAGVGFKTRNAYHASGETGHGTSQGVPRNYLINLDFGVFLQKKMLPLKHLAGNLKIEFTIEDPTKVLIVNSLANVPTSAVTMELAYPRIMYTDFVMDEGFDNLTIELMKENKLNYQYPSWDFSSFSLDYTQERQVFQIPCKRRFLKYAIAVIKCDADYSFQQDSYRQYFSLNPNFTTDFTCPKLSSVKQYQWRYQSQLIPDQPVLCFGFLNPDPSVGSGNNFYTAGTLVNSTPPVEPHYYAELALTRNKFDQLPLGNISTEVDGFPVDPLDPNSNIYSPSVGQTATLRKDSLFAMVGIFSRALPDGTMACLDCGVSGNRGLQLELLFNGVQNTVTPTPMTLEVYTCFDNILTFHDDLSMTLIN